MLNRIVVMGRLTRDPELRCTGSGTPVASLTLAVDRDYANKNGERSTDFFDVVAWRETGEFAAKYFTKGRMAVVAGKLQSRKWQDKNGNNRISWEVIADSMYFGDSKKEADATQQPSTPSAAPPSAASLDGFTEIEDEDLPF